MLEKLKLRVKGIAALVYYTRNASIVAIDKEIVYSSIDMLINFITLSFIKLKPLFLSRYR